MTFDNQSASSPKEVRLRHPISEHVSSTPAPVLAQAQTSSAEPQQRLDELRERAMRLELQVADLSMKAGQLAVQKDQAPPPDQPRLEKQWMNAQHDMTAAAIELSALKGQINRLELTLDAPKAIAMVPPRNSPILSSEQIMQLAGGGGMLMIPLVLVLARNLWVRGSRKTELVDIESSPRLQRIEQSIEAIAVEVERIGEAQRFTTKVLTERQGELLTNRPAAVPLPAPRREAGSITPH